jgi:RepB DNA-primase from phage plasmid
MSGWRADGLTLRAIATKLNGLRLTSVCGCYWYASTVSNALDRFNESQKPRNEESTKERNYESELSLITSQLNEHHRNAMPSFAVPNAGRRTTKEGNELMPFNIQEGQRMLDLFASVGADSFLVTKLDINKKVFWCKPYTPREFRDKLLPMVRTAAVRHPPVLEDGRQVLAGENLIIRPSGTSVSFVQLDDLKADQLDRLRPAAFIIHSTSPGNYQAWFAVSGSSKDKEEFKEFMRRVRKAVGGNDKSASHATRVCGTENFKPDYVPDFPVVTTVHGAPGRVMTAETPSQMGLLAKPEPVQQWAPTVRTYTSDRGRIWPSYEK